MTKARLPPSRLYFVGPKKRVFALLTPEIRGWKMAQMLQKPVFALPDCQRTSVNTLLCDTLGLPQNERQRAQTKERKRAQTSLKQPLAGKPTFFCASFFPFCLPPPFTRQFSSPKSPLSGTSDLLFLVEKRQPLLGLGTVLDQVAPQEKRKILFFWRARKGE